MNPLTAVLPPGHRCWHCGWEREKRDACDEKHDGAWTAALSGCGLVSGAAPQRPRRAAAAEQQRARMQLLGAWEQRRSLNGYREVHAVRIGYACF
eukprot:COSAG05_NODE_1293_length_5260_cov_2.373571_2_plen_95_part_00